MQLQPDSSRAKSLLEFPPKNVPVLTRELHELNNDILSLNKTNNLLSQSHLQNSNKLPLVTEKIGAASIEAKVKWDAPQAIYTMENHPSLKLRMRTCKPFNGLYSHKLPLGPL